MSTVDFLTLLDKERQRQNIEADEQELMPASEGYIPADRGHSGKQGMFESWSDYLDRLDREYSD